MAGKTDSPIITDGSTSFIGGVDSLKATTIADPYNPRGLRRDQLAWLANGTVRDAGISPRSGWTQICRLSDGKSLFQHGTVYQPDSSSPYLIFQIGGRIIKADANSGVVTDLSSGALVNPALADKAFFAQAEQFLVIQGGDRATLPLFWDGHTLRRSKGITNTAVAPGTPGINEIPTAGPMAYYMGRLWYAQDRTYSAGDIVGGNSGTLANRFRDAVLNVTENPLVVGGDGFTVPDNSGNIRALAYAANINASLGEGLLYIFTHKAIYALTVPVTRTNWIAATSNNQPLQTIVQLVNGAVGDDCVVPVNGDLYFQSFEPGIRSLVAAIRYFQQPGNIQVSSNENRILQLNDRSLLRFASGVEIDNRLLMTALPYQTPCGVAHRALVPLDFVPVSSFNEQYAPVWEGHYEGIQIMQVLGGDFDGKERAFAVVRSETDGAIYLWEIVTGQKFDGGDKRIDMQIEFPAYTWGHVTRMKQMVGGELWVDRLYGTVEFQVDYRVDGETCWVPWFKWKECSARDSNEFGLPLMTYPSPLGMGYRQTMDLPKPPAICDQMRRPSDRGFQFQPRVTIHGYCRVRGILLHAYWIDKKLYERIPG